MAESAAAWIGAQLSRLGLARTAADRRVQSTPWSQVVLVSTTAGHAWFKACRPAVRHEPAVCRILAAHAPALVLAPLAADERRGWLLLPDGGPTVRRLGAGPVRWQAALADYAELQIAVAGAACELLEAGVPDHRPERIPDRYLEIVRDPDPLVTGPPDGLDPGELARLRSLGGRVLGVCELLAGGPLPPTIQHDDLGDGNMVVRDGRYVPFDWGDSCVSHPFVSLVVALRVAAHGMRVADDDPVLRRLQAAYLEPWTRLATRAECERLLEAALWIGPFCRTLTWHRIVSGMTAGRRAAYADAVPGWLRIFLAAAAA